MFRFFIVSMLALIGVSTEANTKIYKVIKPDGTVLYTDKPVPGAVPVEMNIPQNVTPALVTPKRSKISTPSENVNKSASSPPPTVSITSPSNEETIRSNAGDVVVQGDTNKATTGLYRLILDDKVMAEKKLPQFSLTNVPRGAHTIQIILVNKGKQLASSEKVTFYLHKVSVINR